MGIIAENCVNCSKNEKEKVKEDKSNISERKIEAVEPILTTTQKTIVSETKVGDENCKGTISIIMDDKKVDDSKREEKNKKKILTSSVFLFTSIFYKDPSLSYDIIPDIFSNNQNIKKVSLKNNQKISRLMKIIDGKEILSDKIRKKCFLKDIKTIQLLDHPNVNKIYEIYEFEDNFYLILNYFDENNLIKKIEGCGLEEESSVNIIMNQIFNSIIYLHENDIYNIDLTTENILIYEIVLKTKKKTLINKGKKSTDSEHNNNNKKKEIKKVESLKKK
jgi:tRNA A-37 threonylcarbamoyl transferase component Bud32